MGRPATALDQRTSSQPKVGPVLFALPYLDVAVPGVERPAHSRSPPADGTSGQRNKHWCTPENPDLSSVIVVLATTVLLQCIGFCLDFVGMCQQVPSIQARETSGILSNEGGQPSLLKRSQSAATAQSRIASGPGRTRWPSDRGMPGRTARAAVWSCLLYTSDAADE